MATSDNTTYFFTGNNPISFRAMQTSFVNGNTNVVSMSDYVRITNGDTAPANMVVPNATENANVNTSTSDMKVSDYRGSIKEKIFEMTGDVEKYDISKMRDSIFSFPYQLEDMIEKYDLFTF